MVPKGGLLSEKSGGFLLLSILQKSLFTVSSSNKWKWIPKDGSDVWGFIKQLTYPGYLTTDKCKDGICTLKVQEGNISGEMKIQQHWRKWNDKIISKNPTRKFNAYVLTQNSEGNIVAMSPNDNENQDWFLSEINE